MKKIFILLIGCFMTMAAGAQSIQELRDSMALGNLNSQVDLGIEYLRGDSLEQNWPEGFKLIEDAALKGNRYGQLWLGICYSQGIMVDKDAKEAFKWYTKSAEKGNVAAMYQVASCYENGEGVNANMNEAFKWYKQSADGGYITSQVSTAVFYEHGKGVERNLDESFRYMKMASDNEYATDGTQFLLAKYYFNGWGTAVDRNKARQLLENIKEESWKNDAKICLDRMEKDLTMSMYDFQFRYIPGTLWLYEKKKTDWKDLTDVTEWQLELGARYISSYEWDWKDISTSTHVINDSTQVVVYRFPQPEKTPLCLFSAAVINTKTGECSYYTLEKTLNIENAADVKTKYWIVGGMARDNASHVSYDMAVGDISEQEFITLIMKKQKKVLGKTTYPTK